MCNASNRKYSGRSSLVDRARAKRMLDGIALASDRYVRRNSPDPIFSSTVSGRRRRSVKSASPRRSKLRR